MANEMQEKGKVGIFALIFYELSVFPKIKIKKVKKTIDK